MVRLGDPTGLEIHGRGEGPEFLPRRPTLPLGPERVGGDLGRVVSTLYRRRRH